MALLSVHPEMLLADAARCDEVAAVLSAAADRVAALVVDTGAAATEDLLGRLVRSAAGEGHRAAAACRADALRLRAARLSYLHADGVLGSG